MDRPRPGVFLAAVPRFSGYAQDSLGLHKEPTLRNVDRRVVDTEVKAFGHNAVFKTLKEIVHFYNTRDTLADCAALAGPRFGENCWPAAEVAVNLTPRN